MLPIDDASNSIITSQCIQQNEYIASSSYIGTSTVSCYRPLDIYYSYAIEIGFITLLFFAIIMLGKSTQKND